MREGHAQIQTCAHKRVGTVLGKIRQVIAYVKRFYVATVLLGPPMCIAESSFSKRESTMQKPDPSASKNVGDCSSAQNQRQLEKKKQKRKKRSQTKTLAGILGKCMEESLHCTTDDKM